MNMKRSLFLLVALFGVNVFAQSLQPEFSQGHMCTLPKEPGTGEGQDLKFYYSEPEKGCLPFYYKGVGGNANRFDTDKECIGNCSAKSDYLDGAEVCQLSPDQGRCHGRFIMFFFSPGEGTCRTFLYGGCSGNGNRFDSREKCLSTCLGKAGRSGTGEMGGPDPNPDEYSGNSGLIVGVLGGCIFAVAITTAIAVFIKNKKNSGRKKVPTQDIEMS